MTTTNRTQRPPEPDYCYKAQAIRILGLTPRMFDKLGLVPAKTVPNPYHRSTDARLFDRAKIEALKDDPRVAALRPRPRRPKDWPGQFRRRYGTARAALPNACHALFNLNRYCKHGSCSGGKREVIYGLKSKLIRILYQNGYSTETYRHEREQPEQKCRECDGTGDGYDYDTGDPVCCCCAGTGVWREARALAFICFRFCVDGEFFTWHQPKEQIGYLVRLTGGRTQMPETEVKPLEVPRSKLTEARRLLEWVVSEWKPNEEMKTNRAA